MATAFGWTFEYIDRFVTLPQLKEMSDYWRKFPPLHEMIAARFGMGQKGSRVAEESAPAEDALMSLFRDVEAAGGSVPREMLEEPKLLPAPSEDPCPTT